MKNELSQLEIHFNTFYTNYPSTKVMSYPTFLVYRVANFMAKECCQQANELIQRLKLPLIAKPNASNGIFLDSFIVEGI